MLILVSKGITFFDFWLPLEIRAYGLFSKLGRFLVTGNSQDFRDFLWYLNSNIAGFSVGRTPRPISVRNYNSTGYLSMPMQLLYIHYSCIVSAKTTKALKQAAEFKLSGTYWTYKSLDSSREYKNTRNTVYPATNLVLNKLCWVRTDFEGEIHAREIRSRKEGHYRGRPS